MSNFQERLLSILFAHSDDAPIWHYRNLIDLLFKGCLDLTSQGRPESTSWGRSLADVLKTSKEPSKDLLRTLWCRLLDIPKLHFTFFLKSVVHSEPNQASMMKLFVKIVNCFYQLTIFTKRIYRTCSTGF